MGGLGSGRRKVEPDAAELDKARLELGREVAWAGRRGETTCKCRLRALEIVLHGSFAVIAENRRLLRALKLARAGKEVEDA
jgi:hypothetical protein